MDEQALNELLECSVCLERLDHTSKVLPCQHTFCRRCLDEIVSTKKELRCPECRTLVSYRVEDLPANILLIRLLEGLKHANQIVSSSSSSTGAFKAKPPSRRHESLNINLSHTSGSKRQFEAKALYNYDAKEPGDLSFKKGEIITVCRQIDQNWYYGELNGQDGYFPSSYVQVVSNFSSSVPQVKALYDFDIKDENEKDCLKFQKDEILQLIRKVDDNWLEGRRGDKIGIFPLSFVELNDAAKSLVASRSRSSSSSSVGVCDGGPSGTSSGRSSAPAPGSRLPSSSFQQIWHHLPQQRERVALHPPTPNTAANAAASLPPPPLNAPMAAMASTSAQQKRHSFTATSHTHSANSSPTIQQRRSLELSPTSGAMPPTSPLHVALPPPPAPACSGNVGSASAMKLLAHLESSGQIPDDNKPGSADTNNPDITFGKTAIYSALYNYKPQKEDEVELRKGDYYTVTEKCQDGWYKGHCLKTGVNGVFPGNYVQISRQSSAFGSVNPNMPNVRAKEIPASSSIASADMNNQPGSVFYGSPPPPCSGNMDTPPPAPPPATVSQPHIRTDGSSASHGTSSSSTNLHRQSASGTTARSRTLHHASSVSYTTSSILAAAYHSNNNNSSGGSGNTGVGSGSALSPSVSSSILAAAYSNNNNNSSGGSSNSGVVGGSTLSPSVSSSSQLSSSSTITHTVVDTPGSKSHPGSGGNTSSSSLKNAASMGSCGGAGGHHAQNLNPSSSSSSSSSSHRNVAEFAALQHSMSASTNITPPNVVAGISSTATSHSTSKEKKEKKDRDKPSLVKRLTMGKGKKSKSPSEGEDSVVTLSSDSSHTGHTRYRCIAPYPPQGEMELELKIGDIVLVYKKWEDGWFKGALQRTGKNGLFPGSFVTKCD